MSTTTEKTMLELATEFLALASDPNTPQATRERCRTEATKALESHARIMVMDEIIRQNAVPTNEQIMALPDPRERARAFAKQAAALGRP